MSFFDRQLHEWMKDPEFAEGYAEADQEINRLAFAEASHVPLYFWDIVELVSTQPIISKPKGEVNERYLTAGANAA